MKLIDKDALVEHLDMLLEKYPKNYYVLCMLDFLDTLEVKEVDLNEEIESYFKGFGKFPSVGIGDCIDIAKHFFELGIKAQKGDNE